MRSIIDSPNLARVTSLGLGGNHLRTEGIEPLVTSPAAGRLRHLGLFKNNLGFADVVALANAPHLANLTSLDLSWNALCGDHRKPYGIAAIEKLTKLERLDIRAAAGSCRFEPEPLAYARWTAPDAEARDVDPTSDAYARKIEMWKRLPLPVANRLGPMIARGLA